MVLRHTFQTSLNNLWISNAFAHVAMSEMANTITMADIQLTNAFGPCAICLAGALLPPVGLPSANTDGTRVDRKTIAQHLLHDETNPFTREHLTMDMVVPDTALKAEIDAWVSERT